MKAFTIGYAGCYNLVTADNGNRTRLSSLGSWHSTNELYPHEYYISITANEQKEKYKNIKEVTDWI